MAQPQAVTQKSRGPSTAVFIIIAVLVVLAGLAWFLRTPLLAGISRMPVVGRWVGGPAGTSQPHVPGPVEQELLAKAAELTALDQQLKVTADELAAKAADLNRRETDLAAALLTLESRDAELAQRELAVAAREDNVAQRNRVLAIYRNMRAKDTAAALAAMTNTEALEILPYLDPTLAAKVLAEMDPARVAVLTQRLMP